MTGMEVGEATAGLAGGLAPGPGRFPAEIFKHLGGALIPCLVGLSPGIYSKGSIPERPIPLLNVTMEILDGVIYHRMLPAVEPMLYPSQYAHRRVRGPQRYLAPLMNGAHRYQLMGRNVYVASFHVAGACDTVSHWRLVGILDELGADSDARRLLHHDARGEELSF